MMNITTFQDDLLELQGFAARLEQFIKTEHEFVESGLVIALSSKFGSGKSTFLQMWTDSLKEREEEKHLVINLNAWESDYNGDPLFAIVSALAKTIQEKGEAAVTLLEAAKDFGWFATTIGSQLVNKFTGIDPVAAGENAEKKKAERREGVPLDMDAFSIFEGRRIAMDSLKKAIQEIVSSSTPRAFFIVDELDRCRPDYAITYLETIKHIFDIRGAVFILAADRKQLENSAKTAFGLELDFEEYYRKFVHREVSLPSISKASYERLTAKYVNYYLEREGSRFCYMELNQDRIDNISELIDALKLTPRQIQEVFRTLGHMFETTEQKKGRLLWCLGVGSIAMAAFKLGAPKIFHKLGAQKLDAVEAINFLNEMVGGSYASWWFKLFLTGGGLHMDKGESWPDVMMRAGLIDEENGKVPRSDLSQWQIGWDHNTSNRFRQIYEKIQQISQWN
jgi:hypothetical protein